MIWHPLTLALMLVEVLAGVVYLAAAVRLFVVLPSWNSRTDGAEQLVRERFMEIVAFKGFWAAVLHSIGFILILVGISNLWPSFVPGAMCGTGVLQALGPPARQALLLKILTLLILYGWHAVMKLEGRVPEPTAVGFHGRLFLVAMPFWAMGSWSLFKAVGRVNAVPPVSCCAALYDQALGDRGVPLISATGPGVWIAVGMVAALVVMGWGVAMARRPDAVVSGQTNIFYRIGPLALVWSALPVAYIVLTRAVAPYVLEVLHHPCPWCLLLWDHRGIGFLFFALPLWVAVESTVAVLTGHLARRHAVLACAAALRIQRAGLRILSATLVFVVVAALPALWWYLRFGGWMR